jgi:hypothetical protein
MKKFLISVIFWLYIQPRLMAFVSLCFLSHIQIIVRRMKDIQKEQNKRRRKRKPIQILTHIY